MNELIVPSTSRILHSVIPRKQYRHGCLRYLRVSNEFTIASDNFIRHYFEKVPLNTYVCTSVSALRESDIRSVTTDCKYRYHIAA